ncbi:hypothetical protein QE152_g8009 [Popillia japonica]|uniref:Uncharacterized protein n=1 Tax=Popillia japonica TaxID=7064 RepID=A0AAW1MBN4_POPJA
MKTQWTSDDSDSDEDDDPVLDDDSDMDVDDDNGDTMYILQCRQAILNTHASYAWTQHWTKSDWPPRETLEPGEKNATNTMPGPSTGRKVIGHLEKL